MERLSATGQGLSGILVSPVCQDHKGNLWVSGNRAVALGARSSGAIPASNGVTQATAAVEDDSGDLLLSTNDGLKRLSPGDFARLSTAWDHRSLRVLQIAAQP